MPEEEEEAMAGQGRKGPQDGRIPWGCYAAGAAAVAMLLAGMGAPMLARSGMFSPEEAQLFERLARPLLVAACIVFPLCEIFLFGAGRRAPESGQKGAAGEKAQARAPHPATKLAAGLLDMAMESVPLGPLDSAVRDAAVRRLRNGEQEFLSFLQKGKSIEGIVRFLLAETLHDALHARVWREGRLKQEDMPLLKACLVHLAKAKEYGFLDERECRLQAERLRAVAQAGRRRAA